MQGCRMHRKVTSNNTRRLQDFSINKQTLSQLLRRETWRRTILATELTMFQFCTWNSSRLVNSSLNYLLYCYYDWQIRMKHIIPFIVLSWTVTGWCINWPVIILAIIAGCVSLPTFVFKFLAKDAAITMFTMVRRPRFVVCRSTYPIWKIRENNYQQTKQKNRYDKAYMCLLWMSFEVWATRSER